MVRFDVITLSCHDELPGRHQICMLSSSSLRCSHVCRSSCWCAATISCHIIMLSQTVTLLHYVSSQVEYAVPLLPSLHTAAMSSCCHRSVMRLPMIACCQAYERTVPYCCRVEYSFVLDTNLKAADTLLFCCIPSICLLCCSCSNPRMLKAASNREVCLLTLLQP